MKKMTAALTVLMLAVPATVYADAELTVTQQDVYFTETEYSGVSVDCFVKIENTGDVPARVGEAYLEMTDQDGNELTASGWDVPARYLQPGEYTYYSIEDTLWDVEHAEDIIEYEFVLETSEDVDREDLRLPCETKLEKDVPGIYWYQDLEDHLYAIVTNDTDEPLYDISFVLALLDEDGHILTVSTAALTYGLALMPGSSLMDREIVEQTTSLGRHLQEEGITSASVDTIAYVERELPEEEDE